MCARVCVCVCDPLPLYVHEAQTGKLRANSSCGFSEKKVLI
jgi:hypothetical protein